MIHGLKITLLTALSGMLLLSCQQSIEPLTPSSGMECDLTAPISIGVTGMQLTRGYDPLTTSTIADIGVFAGYSAPNQTFNASTQAASAFSNAKFSKGADGKWHGSTPRYWPVTGSLSLFAYAPYSESVTVASSYAGGPLAISYSPNQDMVTSQTDLSVAAPVFNKDKTAGVQSLAFQHTTALVLFYGNYTGTPPDGTFKPQIDRIEIGGVIGTKTLTFGSSANPDQYSWEADGTLPKDATYILYNSRNEVHNDPASYPLPLNTDNAAGINLSDLNGRLYMLPQTLTAQNTLKIYWSFMQKNGSSWVRVSQFVEETHLPYGEGAPVWEAGKKIVYHMTLDLGSFSLAGITASVTDWIDSGNPTQNSLIE